MMNNTTVSPRFSKAAAQHIYSKCVQIYSVAKNKDTKPALSKNPLETGCFSNYYLNNAL